MLGQAICCSIAHIILWGSGALCIMLHVGEHKEKDEKDRHVCVGVSNWYVELCVCRV